MTDLWTMHRWDIWLYSGRFITGSIILHHFLLRSSGSSLCKVKAWHMAILEAPRLSCSLQRDPRQIAFIMKQSEGSTKQWKKAAACRLSFKCGGHLVHNDELQLWFQGWNSFNPADFNILYQDLFLMLELRSIHACLSSIIWTKHQGVCRDWRSARCPGPEVACGGWLWR